MSEKSAKAIVVAVSAWLAFYGLKLRPSHDVQSGAVTSPLGQVDRYKYLSRVALAFLGLTILADISPEVAGPLALLLALAVLGVYLKQRDSLASKPGSNAAGTRIIAPSTGG